MNRCPTLAALPPSYKWVVWVGGYVPCNVTVDVAEVGGCVTVSGDVNVKCYQVNAFAQESDDDSCTHPYEYTVLVACAAFWVVNPVYDRRKTLQLQCFFQLCRTSLGEWEIIYEREKA